MTGLLRRYLRVGLAMAVLVCLMVVILVSRSQLIEEDRRLTHTMSTLAWKVSQTIFEAQRLERDFLRFRLGEIDSEEVAVSTEVFWSRIDVMRKTQVVEGTSLRDKLDEIERYLEQNESIIFGGDAALEPHISSLEEFVMNWRRDFRKIWIGQRAHNRELVIELVEEREHWSAAISEYLIFGCVLALAIYMATELALSHRAHDRERAWRQAETKANLAKSAFLANVSHEVRTPLNGVLGLAQELEETDLDATQLQLVSIIRNSGELLLATINDVLDLSKIESGKMLVEEREFNLPQRLRHCFALHERSAQAAGLEFSVHFPDDIPERVIGDALRMAQVINNLLSNAIKFTSTGGIDIFVRATKVEPDRLRLGIAVRDTGIGISKSAQQEIFAPFVQAEADTTRRFGGTGLGLTISRNICRHFNGDLTVASVPGQGSTFTARFEVGLADARSDEKTLKDTNCLSQADEGGAATTNVVALPNFKQAHGNDNALPVKACSDETAEDANAAETAASADVKILIVDDSETNRFVLRRYLRGFPADISESSSGEDALQKISARKFDLVFMDVQMPGIDGAEATRRLRALEAEHGEPPIPIVAATANVMTHQVEEYLEAGMNDVLAKPIRKTEFLDLMRRLGHKQVA